MNLNEFAKEVHALAVEKGFYDPEPTDAELIAAIHSEISEAFEEWRAGRPMVWHLCLDWDDQGCVDKNGCADCDNCTYKPGILGKTASRCLMLADKPEGIAVELIDVVLRVFDLAVGNAHRLREDAYGYAPDTIAEMTLPELAIYIHHEVGALYTCNWYNKALSLYGSECALHLSCILTAILTWLRAHDIDPEALMREKHEYNKTRPYRHGGKRV